MKISELYMLLTFLFVAIGAILILVGHTYCGIIVAAMGMVYYRFARTQDELDKVIKDMSKLQSENYELRREEWKSIGVISEAWIAKDDDRKIHLFKNKPRYNYRNGRFEPVDYPYHEESSYMELKDISVDITPFGSPKKVKLDIKYEYTPES
jgi:hypothetical protein